MAHSVEQKLMAMLGEAKGGSAEVEGAKEFKLLKERQVSRAKFFVVAGSMELGLIFGLRLLILRDFCWMSGHRHALYCL
jgi:hypothetical protein